MPHGNYFSFCVQIGGKNQEEYIHDSKNYIVVDLLGQNGYFVEETDGRGEEREVQRYPVIPFKFEIQKHYSYPCWVSMYMDGQLVQSRPITRHGRCTQVFGTIKRGNLLQELSFSLPRMSQEKTLTDSRIQDAGSLKIICCEAIPSHEEMVPIPRYMDRCDLPTTISFPQLTKRDMHSLNGGVGVVCREGRTVTELMYDGCQYRSRVKYVRGEVLQETTLYYGSKLTLAELGVIPQDNIAQGLNKMSLTDCNTKEDRVFSKDVLTDCSNTNAKHMAWPNNKKKEHKDDKKEVDECMSPMRKGVCRNQYWGCMSPTALKHEKIKKEVLDSNLVCNTMDIVYDSDDDDLIYVETTYIKKDPDEMNNSVICMGDDSCYEFEMAPDDVSVIDLVDI